MMCISLHKTGRSTADYFASNIESEDEDSEACEARGTSLHRVLVLALVLALDKKGRLGGGQTRSTAASDKSAFWQSSRVEFE